MVTTTDWTQTFFSGFILETLPFWTTKEQTQQETDFLVRTLAPARGERIIDVPCGNGRLAHMIRFRTFSSVIPSLHVVQCQENDGPRAEKRPDSR